MIILILRQSLQRFAKTFYLFDCLITPKREGQVMGDLDVESFPLIVSEVLDRAEDILELILIVVIPLRTTDAGANEEQ